MYKIFCFYVEKYFFFSASQGYAFNRTRISPLLWRSWFFLNGKRSIPHGVKAHTRQSIGLPNRSAWSPPPSSSPADPGRAIGNPIDCRVCALTPGIFTSFRRNDVIKIKWEHNSTLVQYMRSSIFHIWPLKTILRLKSPTAFTALSVKTSLFAHISLPINKFLKCRGGGGGMSPAAESANVSLLNAYYFCTPQRNILTMSDRYRLGNFGIVSTSLICHWAATKATEQWTLTYPLAKNMLRRWLAFGLTQKIIR